MNEKVNLNEEILKPLSVSTFEFKEKLAKIINECDLPPFIIELILKNLVYEINGLSKKQLDFENKLYKEKINEQEKIIKGNDK